jgi:hypothetical protein
LKGETDLFRGGVCGEEGPVADVKGLEYTVDLYNTRKYNEIKEIACIHL